MGHQAPHTRRASSCFAALAGFVSLAAVTLVSVATGYLGDSANHPPPSSGPYAYYPPYGSFGPNQPGFLAVGQSYVDPVFGTTIRRLSNVYPGVGNSLAYAKNGIWNANGTRYAQPPDGNGMVNIIDTTTGAIVVPLLPYFNGTNGEGSFDPVDPDLVYYFSGSSLKKYSLATALSTTVKTFSATLGGLGGSIDYIDNSGRYMALNIGGQLSVWDRQADVLYSGNINADFGGGYAGMAPDGTGVLWAGNGTARWHAIDHAARSVNATGFVFFSGGDHGDVVSASDGNTYFVTAFANASGDPAVGAVNVRTGAIRQMFVMSWCDDQHFSGISRGPMRDWALVDTEITTGSTCVNADSASNPNPIASWWPYRQEVVMVNVLTSEVRRLAHHRTRRADQGYCIQPRINVNWDGTKAIYASNYGVVNTVGSCGYSDIYSIDIPNSASPPPKAPTNLLVQ